MKYNVGDKVKVKENLSEDDSNEELEVCSQMLRFRGQWVTISGVFEDENCYELEEDSNKYGWTDKMFFDSGRELICPAIYRHFKHKEDGNINNYLYATMFVSEPIDENNNIKYNYDTDTLYRVTNTETGKHITIIVSKDKCYHAYDDCNEKMVIYRSMYDFGNYARPYSMFLSKVDHEKYPDIKQKYRFELV